MTLVSHKHRFIYIKSGKTASTSIQVALGKHCGENDVVTPVAVGSKIDETRVKTPFSLLPEQTGFVIPVDGNYDYIPRNYTYYQNHMQAYLLKQVVGDWIWDNYYKICPVRNPWERVVCLYFGRMSKMMNEEKVDLETATARQPFEDFVDSLFGWMIHNEIYYFVGNGIQPTPDSPSPVQEDSPPAADYYIRFENLEEDYKNLCSIIGISYEPLPRLKTIGSAKPFTERNHYSEYYTPKTRKKVAELYKKTIDYFGYEF